MGLQGFDETYYLSVKLASLQAQYPEWAGKDAQFLKGMLLSVYGLTPEDHYVRFGYAEGLDPNPYFSHEEYRFAKATDLVEKGFYEDMESALDGLDTAWQGDLYQHYLSYGAAEGLNPSNSFDETRYLVDKLLSLQQNGTYQSEWIGKTTEDLRNYLSALGMTALGHYYLYGAAEGLSPEEVPADRQVDPTDKPWEMPHDNVILPSELHLTWVNSDEISGTPYNAIGMVNVITGSQISYGTGFLISPEHVLTNAHVLLSEDGELTSTAKVIFFPALNGERSDETPQVFADTAWVETTFGSSLYPEWPDNDLAILSLTTPIDLSGGYFALEQNPGTISAESVTSAGYPVNAIVQDDPATPGADFYQWEVSGTIETLYFGESVLGLSSEMAVTAGASGSPVFYTTDDIVYVSGVLSGTIGDTTVAAAIDQDSYNWILGILQQDGYYTDYTLI